MDILSSVTDEDFTLFRCTYIYIYLLHILFGDDDDENYIIILGAIYSSALLLPPGHVFRVFRVSAFMDVSC